MPHQRWGGCWAGFLARRTAFHLQGLIASTLSFLKTCIKAVCALEIVVRCALCDGIPYPDRSPAEEWGDHRGGSRTVDQHFAKAFEQ